MPGLKHVASLQRSECLFIVAVTNAQQPQAAQHPAQKNLYMWVACVEHLCSFFKRAYAFAGATLK